MRVGIRAAAVALVLIAACRVAVAQQASGNGLNTGDGSTPFTGIAQAPEANLLMGTATTGVPIQLPPGRKSMTPQLTLAYNSNGGPSPYGFGWNLSVPRIQRSMKRGVPTCVDPAVRNEFVLTLPGASIECTTVGGVAGRCVPKVEEGFIDIRGDGTNKFKVRDKSGVTYYFGGTNGDTVGTVSTDWDAPTFSSSLPAVTGSTTTTDWSGAGAGCQYTGAWALRRIEDPNGNRIDYQYILDQGTLYPYSISYGGHSSGTPAHRFRVLFKWENRDDAVWNSLGGYPTVISKRLARVEVYYVPPSGPQELVRAYGMTYATGRSGRQTFLSAVTLYGSTNQALAQGNSTTPAAATYAYHAKTSGFDASPSAWALQLAARPSFPTLAPYAMRWFRDSGTRRDVQDMNGDAFPDIVDTDATNDCSAGVPPSPTPPAGGATTWRVYLGSKLGFSASATNWWVPYSDVMCNLRKKDADKTWFATVDLTGDGIPDYVDARDPTWRVYPGTPTSPGGGWGFAALPISWSAGYANVQRVERNRQISFPGSGNNWTGGTVVTQDLIDINGDGRLDLVRAPGGDEVVSLNWEVRLNNGAGFGAPETIIAPFPGLSFSVAGGLLYGIFDVNGDGLPDGVWAGQPAGGAVTAPAWSVCLNTGWAMNVCQPWPIDKRVLNSSGQLAGNGEWRYLRRNADGDTIRDFVDITGDGLPDIVDATGYQTNTGNWTVFPNRIDGFEATPLAWAAPFNRLRKGNTGGETNTQDLLDIDGDGLVELVDFYNYEQAPAIYRTADAAWRPASGAPSTVVDNPTAARPDILVASENGVGGATTLAYRPSVHWTNTGLDGIADLPFNTWTVTSVTRSDGMCSGASCLNDSAHTVGTRFT